MKSKIFIISILFLIPFIARGQGKVTLPQKPTSDNVVSKNTLNSKIKKDASISKTIIVNEPGYMGTFYICVEKDKAVVKFNVNESEGMEKYRFSKNSTQQQVLAQLEGLILFNIASVQVNTAVEENGGSVDTYIRSAVKLLKKSYAAFDSKRGKTAKAYADAKDRCEMLEEILQREDQGRFQDLEIIAWGMEEHPISIAGLRYME